MKKKLHGLTVIDTTLHHSVPVEQYRFHTPTLYAKASGDGMDSLLMGGAGSGVWRCACTRQHPSSTSKHAKHDMLSCQECKTRYHLQACS